MYSRSVGVPPLADIAAAVVGQLGSNSPPISYTQSSPLATWTIPHVLGRIPAVQVYVGGVQVDTDVSASSTQVVCTFASPVTGVAVLI